MDWKKILYYTAIIYSLNGSLDGVVNDKYSSVKTEISPYIIDSIIHKNWPNYSPNMVLDLKK